MVNVEFEVYPKFGEAYTETLTLTEDGFDELRILMGDEYLSIVCSLLKIDKTSVNSVVILKNE